MTPVVEDATVAARVPTSLRQDLEAVRDLVGDPDLSVTMRRLLRAGADVELKRGGRIDLERLQADLATTPAGGLFGPRPGARRKRGRATSEQAAADVAPRSGSQRRRALEVLAHRAAHGATADEVIAELERQAVARGVRPPAVNGVARRVTDLLQAGAIEPVRFDRVDRVVGPGFDRPVAPGELVIPGYAELTRRTRNGAQATVYAITAKGLEWLNADTLEEPHAR